MAMFRKPATLPSRAAMLAAFALPLSGCISLGPKPPPTLLTLDAAAVLPAGQTRPADDARAVAVAVPAAAPTLAPQRLMVEASPGEVAYIKGAQWAAAPAVLFRGLLAETIEARTGRFVPDQRNTGSQPDTRLSGTLARFGLDARAGAAVVTFDAMLAHSGSTALTTRRFTATAPVARQDGPAVGAALDVAANQVATQIADWIGR